MWKYDVCPSEFGYSPVYLASTVDCDGTEESLEECETSSSGTCAQKLFGCDGDSPADQFKYQLVRLICTSKCLANA